MYQMYMCYVQYMSKEHIETMAEVRQHLADVADRAYRDHTPTIMTRRGRREVVILDYDRYKDLIAMEEAAEEAWLNRLAAASEAEGREPSVSLEEMWAIVDGRESPKGR